MPTLKEIVVTVAAAAALAGILALLIPPRARADALFQAAEGPVVITLYDEPCALEAVTNLPRRATWLEAGVVTEGCWGAQQDAALVISYWADRTVGVFPYSALRRVVSS